MSNNTQSAIDAMPLIVAVLGFIFAFIQALSKYYIDKRIHNQQMRELLEKAVQNGLGVIQQVASGAAYKAAPEINKLVPPNLAPGVQYVLDHAAEAITHFKLDPAAIAEKLIARAGQREIETNIATTASAGSAAVIPPLAPSLPATDPVPTTRQEALAPTQSTVPLIVTTGAGPAAV